MQSEVRTYLFDIAAAISAIEEFTAGRSLEEYEQDLMLRSAVERQFGIIGEATRARGTAGAIPTSPPGSATTARSSTSAMFSPTSTSGSVTQPSGAWLRTVFPHSAGTSRRCSLRTDAARPVPRYGLSTILPKKVEASISSCACAISLSGNAAWTIEWIEPCSSMRVKPVSVRRISDGPGRPMPM